MKKIRVLITVLVVVLLIFISIVIEITRPVVPPVRVAEKKSRGGSQEKIYNLEIAMEEADIIAHIKIGDWLGEDKSNTYYEASLVENFSGEITEDFILMQTGSSSVTRVRYPLFTYGNELLVFLKKYDWPSEYENLYYILASPFYIVTDDAGNMYYYDRFNLLKETVDSGIIHNIPVDSFARGLYDKLIEEDVLVEEEIIWGFEYFYKSEDLESLINKQ